MASAWARFEELAVPADASAAQRRQARRAFYAGAHALFDIQVRGLDPDGRPTEAAMAHLNRIRNEVLQFGVDVRAGKA